MQYISGADGSRSLSCRQGQRRLGGKHEIVDHSPDGEITLVRENQENLEENQNFPSFNGVVVKIKEPLLLNHLAHIH